MISRSNHFDFVTVAKGFAIVCVVLGHFTPSFMPSFFQHLKAFVYLFHMPLFMLLAGFLFQNSVVKRGGEVLFLPFMKKKFLRLMVPYFFLSFAIAALNLCLQQFMPVKRTVDVLYVCRLFYENVGGSATFLWFLYTLFIIFGIAVLFMRIQRGRLLLLMGALVMAFVPAPTFFYLNTVCGFLLYFVVGTFLYDWMSGSSFVLSGKNIAVALVVFLVSIVVRSLFSVSLVMLVTNYTCGLSACLLLIALSKSLACQSGGMVRSLKVTGHYSSYIYLLHMAGVYPVRVVYEHMGWYTSFSYAVFLIVAVVTGCLLPVLIGKYIISRYPGLLFLMGERKKTVKNLVGIKK